MALKNILVATDFSEPSSVAMAYGRDLARNYNARLHVMHVVEDVMLRYSSEVGSCAAGAAGRSREGGAEGARVAAHR